MAGAGGRPMGMWTSWRRVVPLVPGTPNVASGFFAAMGEAARVPTQWSAGEAAVAMEGERRQRESGRRRETLDLIDIAFLGLNLIGSRSILSLFRGGAGVDV